MTDISIATEDPEILYQDLLRYVYDTSDVIVAGLHIIPVSVSQRLWFGWKDFFIHRHTYHFNQSALLPLVDSGRVKIQRVYPLKSWYQPKSRLHSAIIIPPAQFVTEIALGTIFQYLRNSGYVGWRIDLKVRLIERVHNANETALSR